MVADIKDTQNQHNVIPSVARALLVAGMLQKKQVAELVQSCNKSEQDFFSFLIKSQLVSSKQIAQALMEVYALPYIDLSAVDPSRLPQNVLSAELTQEYRTIILSQHHNRIVIASDDPTNRDLSKKITFATQMSIEWVVVAYDDLTLFLNKLKKSSEQKISSSQFEFGDLKNESPEKKATESAAATAAAADVEDAPIVRFLQKMLTEAVNMGASDLHFEPYEFNYRIRFRIDSVLQDHASPPLEIKEKLASRIKVISRMDISEKRIPQDGRTKMKIGGKTIDFRVSTLPTLFGEKIAIRILDSSSAKMGIDALGYEKLEKQRLMQAIKRPYGMILVTGPTGSGKTVSLYTCLNLLNTSGVNISTAEDPSEINMPGVNQVNVNEKAGLTFAAALRSFLRQDPDIIMVGEIRDLETADIAIKAAQTGHLVLSTLHTNDAPSTLTRLRNMGIAPFNIASSVILITAQRLARRLCEFCKQEIDIAVDALIEAGFTYEDLDGSWKSYRAIGCPSCNNGYKGRVGIYQVMPISEEIQRMIIADGSALDIEAQAEKEGVLTLRKAGLLKVKAGVTSLEEVLAVTNE